MIKRMAAVLVLFTLITVAMVQAVGKDDAKETASTTGETGIEIGQLAPDFELQTLEGRTVKLSDYQGKKVMLNFWATWCPPCRAEMPDMEKFYSEMKEDVEILAVNIDTTNDVAGFVKDMGVSFPILLDEKEVIMRDFNIISIPTTYILDEQGVIRDKTIGAMTYEHMIKLIDKM